jgi:hypothetical protein
MKPALCDEIYIPGKVISNPANCRLREVVKNCYRTYTECSSKDKGTFIKSLIETFRGETSPERRFILRCAEGDQWREASEAKVYNMVQRLLIRKRERMQLSCRDSKKAEGRRNVTEGTDEVAPSRCSSGHQEATSTAETDVSLPLATPGGALLCSDANQLALEPPRSPPSWQITSFGLPLYTVDSRVCHSLNPAFYNTRICPLPDLQPDDPLNHVFHCTVDQQAFVPTPSRGPTWPRPEVVARQTSQSRRSG